MEDTLRGLGMTCENSEIRDRLNPCSNGRYSQRLELILSQIKDIES